MRALRKHSAAHIQTGPLALRAIRRARHAWAVRRMIASVVLQPALLYSISIDTAERLALMAFTKTAMYVLPATRRVTLVPEVLQLNAQAAQHLAIPICTTRVLVLAAWICAPLIPSPKEICAWHAMAHVPPAATPRTFPV